MQRRLRRLSQLFAITAIIVPALPTPGARASLKPTACPTSPNYVVIDCNAGDPNNSGGMFAGAMARYGSGWIVAYMKNWSDGTTTYHTGYTAQTTSSNPFTGTWGSKARMWKPKGTDSAPGVVDPGILILGDDVDVATQPSSIYTSHSTTPEVADTFKTPVAKVVCTGDQDPACLSTEGNGKVSEVSLRPTDVPANGTTYAVYSFCPTSEACTVAKPQQIHLRVVPHVLDNGHYAPWGLPVTCAKDSGWARPRESDNGKHQRAVVVTLAKSGRIGTKMGCFYNQYQGGGARTIGMTTSTNGVTWSSSTTIARETGFDLHNPYAIWMKGTTGTVRVYYQRFNYDGHCNGLGRNWTLNYVQTTNGGASWTMPFGSNCTGIPYPKEITSTSRPIFAQDKVGGHVYCLSTWIDVDDTVLGIFDTKT